MRLRDCAAIGWMGCVACSPNREVVSSSTFEAEAAFMVFLGESNRVMRTQPVSRWHDGVHEIRLEEAEEQVAIVGLSSELLMQSNPLFDGNLDSVSLQPAGGQCASGEFESAVDAIRRPVPSSAPVLLATAHGDGSISTVAEVPGLEHFWIREKLDFRTCAPSEVQVRPFGNQLELLAEIPVRHPDYAEIRFLVAMDDDHVLAATLESIFPIERGQPIDWTGPFADLGENEQIRGFASAEVGSANRRFVALLVGSFTRSSRLVELTIGGEIRAARTLLETAEELELVDVQGQAWAAAGRRGALYTGDFSGASTDLKLASGENIHSLAFTAPSIVLAGGSAANYYRVNVSTGSVMQAQLPGNRSLGYFLHALTTLTMGDEDHTFIGGTDGLLYHGIGDPPVFELIEPRVSKLFQSCALARPVECGGYKLLRSIGFLSAVPSKEGIVVFAANRGCGLLSVFKPDYTCAFTLQTDSIANDDEDVSSMLSLGHSVLVGGARGSVAELSFAP